MFRKFFGLDIIRCSTVLPLSIFVHEDGQRLAATNRAHTRLVFDLQGGEPRLRWPCHTVFTCAMEVVDPNTGIPLSEMPQPVEERGGNVGNKRKRKRHKLAVMGTSSNVSVASSPHRTARRRSTQPCAPRTDNIGQFHALLHEARATWATSDFRRRMLRMHAWVACDTCLPRVDNNVVHAHARTHT